MMNIGTSDARNLTYWEYTGLVSEYNARHEGEPEFDPMAPPDPDLIAFMKERE